MSAHFLVYTRLGRVISLRFLTNFVALLCSFQVLVCLVCGTDARLHCSTLEEVVLGTYTATKMYSCPTVESCAV